MGKEITELLLEDRSEDDDRHSDAGLPKYDSFFYREDGKASDTMPYERARCFDRTMAVGIGFDDCHDIASGAENPTKLGEIVYERRQIYSGDGRKECRRNRHAKK